MLPAHDDISERRQALEAVALAAAGGLLGALVWRLWGSELQAPPLAVLAVAAGGAFAADFVSGIVHWIADTWGQETMPVFGRRFLRPFRVHHVNPDDFLRRRFLDVNGDVAMLTAPILALAHGLPMRGATGQLLAAGVAGFCATILPTNQVHQWAHQSAPPRWVARLQRLGLILSRPAHLRHHRAPHAANYCIATGWCNPFLERIQFFRRLERAVTRWTGLQPRSDDESFRQVFEPSALLNPPDRPDADGNA